jgi:hypothetical protein
MVETTAPKTEQEIRLDELTHLKNHMDGHGVGTGNPDHTMSAYFRNRWDWITKHLAPAPVEAPASESRFVAPSGTTPVATPEAPDHQSFVAPK